MSKETKKPATLDDIFDAVNGLTASTAIESKSIRREFKHELAAMETRLVTKDYLDDKLHELRGDLTVIIRKEDRKVVALIDELRQTKVLSGPAAQRILSLEPFPQS